MKLAKMKVAEMRKELEARGLDSAGTRPTLMKRLREALSNEAEATKPEDQSLAIKPTSRGDHANADTAPVFEESNPSARTTTNHLASEQERSDHPEPARTHPTSPDHAQVGPALNSTKQTAHEDDRVDDTPIETARSSATGSLEQTREASMDERMRKRRERFGANTVSDPMIAEEAVERRRQRFGTVQKEAKPTKQPRKDAVVDQDAARKHEEAKRRRALKFGIVLDAPTPTAVDSAVSAEEMERRLKRQRRFQQVGS